MDATSDDEYGLSSGDEAELAVLSNSNGCLKRKSEVDLAVTVKKQRPNSDALHIATDILRQRFGLQDFRLEQAAAIVRLLEGQSWYD